jgi:hypothetical protein
LRPRGPILWKMCEEEDDRKMNLSSSTDDTKSSYRNDLPTAKS